MIVRRLLSHRSLRAITAADRKAFAALMRKNTEPATEFGVDCLDFTLRIADIVHEIGMERSSIVLALVDPYVRYGAVSIAEVRETFGEDIAHLVELLRKSESKTITLENISDKQFSDFVLSFVEDIRVVIHLIAFHYEAMKAMMPTLNPLPGETPSADNKLPLREDADYEDLMVRLATSSRMFFAPIAHRLGLYNIKRELEDMTIRIEHPKEYDDIMRGLRQTRQEREQYLADFIAPLRQRIEDLGIGYEIKWRTKSISSIYQKMQAKGIGVDGIYDLFALRVILDVPEKLEKALCWAIFGVASSLYVPNMLRTKDWVWNPKPSGYESLHTTVLGPDNHWVEIQIRSKRMDEVAEHGVAAHWIYKGVEGSDGDVNDALLAIRTALEKRDGVDSIIKGFSEELYKDKMFVFDNSDKLHKIPTDSRIVDYIINIAPEPDWVELFSGARVNGELKPLEHLLKNGDRVELIALM